MKFRIITFIVIPLIFYYFISEFNSSGSTTEMLGHHFTGYGIDPIFTPPVKVNKDFTNCIFTPEYVYNKGIRGLYPWLNFDKFNELHYNAFNWYEYVGEDTFGIPEKKLTALQVNNFKKIMELAARVNPPLKGFYEKSDFSYPMYSQRLVYEVQDGSAGNPSDINYGFVYQKCMLGTFINDNGRTVLHAKPGINNAGYLCSDIYENFQHTDLFDFRQDDKGMWYMKPVMKIPQGLPDSTPVVTIEVVSFDNKVVKTVHIKAGNFKNRNGVYDGDYVSDYSNVNLEISGNDSTGCLNEGRNEDFNKWPLECHVDFRVRWDGQAEVWFDKMVVDDSRAEILFKGNWDEAIRQQAQEFTNYASYYTFFTDETCYSQVPCIKYVINLMRTAPNLPPGPLPKFSIAVTNFFQIKGLKNDDLSYKYFFDSLNVDFVQPDVHKFYSWGTAYGSPIPDVFHIYNSRIPRGWYKSAEAYNTWLQNDGFGDRTTINHDNYSGSFIYQVNKIREDSRKYSPGTQLIVQNQLHGWLLSGEKDGVYSNGLREPTNEELQAQAMLALAHGADGLCWFTYESGKWFDKYSQKWFTKFGLLNPDLSERDSNMYGENKWSYVTALNVKLLAWKPTLDNITWQEGYSVHSEGANHYFIDDIQSSYRTGQAIINDAVKYWEEGFFTSPDGSKYFIMVNRRCVPSQDARTLTIKFDADKLSGGDMWKITDVYTGVNVMFNKQNQGTGGYLQLPESMGTFQPGEGKLYKLEPAG